MSPIDRSATRELLSARHGGTSRFGSDQWLTWLYDGNPVGSAIESDRDQDGRRMGHVGLIPQRWRRGDESIEAVLAVNVVTSSSSHEPLFVELFAEGVTAAYDRGVDAVWGVTNEQSTEPTERDLPARHLMTLPVRLARSSRPRGVTSTTVDPTCLSPDWIQFVVGHLDPPPSDVWRHDWSAELLAWRLAAPGHTYALHVSDAGVAVSTETRWGVRVGVVVKLLPRQGPVAAGDTRRLIGAVRRHHRVGPVVYAGFNHLAPVPGVSVPERLRPAALNLFVMGGDDAKRLGIPVGDDRPLIPTDEVLFESCELLDFDAL